MLAKKKMRPACSNQREEAKTKSTTVGDELGFRKDRGNLGEKPDPKQVARGLVTQLADRTEVRETRNGLQNGSSSSSDRVRGGGKKNVEENVLPGL